MQNLPKFNPSVERDLEYERLLAVSQSIQTILLNVAAHFSKEGVIELKIVKKSVDKRLDEIVEAKNSNKINKIN